MLLYDVQILSMVEEWDKLTTDDRLALFRECFMNMRFLLLFLLTIVCALLMLQPIFICLRVDNQVHIHHIAYSMQAPADLHLGEKTSR